jgi:GDPmannose 4,6-dehydratase
MEKHIRIDPRYFRPTEPEELLPDSAKARAKLNWNPKVKFKDLVKIMVDADLRAAGLTPVGEGDSIVKQKFPDRWWGVD